MMSFEKWPWRSNSFPSLLVFREGKKSWTPILLILFMDGKWEPMEENIYKSIRKWKWYSGCLCVYFEKERWEWKRKLHMETSLIFYVVRKGESCIRQNVLLQRKATSFHTCSILITKIVQPWTHSFHFLCFSCIIYINGWEEHIPKLFQL